MARISVHILHRIDQESGKSYQGPLTQDETGVSRVVADKSIAWAPFQPHYPTAHRVETLGWERAALCYSRCHPSLAPVVANACCYSVEAFVPCIDP
jgi:hypothetical protein